MQDAVTAIEAAGSRQREGSARARCSWHGGTPPQDAVLSARTGTYYELGGYQTRNS